MGIVAPGAVSATIGTSGVVFAATNRPALELQRTVAYFLPRDSRPLARDGGDASGWAVTALVPRSVRRCQG
jgi:sugar (pentulose or hexulose) kinase